MLMRMSFLDPAGRLTKLGDDSSEGGSPGRTLSSFVCTRDRRLMFAEVD